MDIEKLKEIHKNYKKIVKKYYDLDKEIDSIDYAKRGVLIEFIEVLEKTFPELNEKQTKFNWDYKDESPSRLLNGMIFTTRASSSFPQYRIEGQGKYYLSIMQLKELVEVLQNAIEIMESEQ